jgi:hypothetical protein
VGGGGRFVLCRHRAIAKASLAVLRETNLFGDIDSTYSDLSSSAISARQKRLIPLTQVPLYVVSEAGRA